MPYDRTYHLLGRLDKIRSRVHRERPDVLEAHSPYLAAAAVVACGRPAPVQTSFWHADHVGAYIQPALEKWLGAGLASKVTSPLWRGVRALLRPFDATFVAGRGQAERLRRAGVRNVIHSPFGIDGETFRPIGTDDERARLRADLLSGFGLDRVPVVMIGVGRFAIEKRWDVVIDAFEQVRARRDAILILFGDGPERARLERRAPPGLRFAGFEKNRARLARALGAADLLVHGCPYETYGLGVAEAVACALPVVVPDAGGAAESADPSVAETYASLDVTACVSAIERLLDRKARNADGLRARALDAAARVPTLKSHYQTVLAAYDALLAERWADPPRVE